MHACVCSHGDVSVCKQKPHRYRQQHCDGQGKGGWGRKRRVRGGQVMTKETGLRVVNTQYNIQMMGCRIIHLKPI